MASSTHKTQINYRSIALPAEHGGWGFLLEPMLLGLLLAASLWGILFCAAMFFLFLTHQPLKIAAKDQLNEKRTPRSIAAERFAIGYLVVAGLLMLPVLITNWQIIFAPLLMMLPLVLIQLWYDFKNQSRAMIPELAGAVALGGTATVVAIIGGCQTIDAFMLWLILGLRAVPAILYVRSFFRKMRGKPASIMQTYAAHIIALVIIIALAIGDYLPLLTIIPFVLLLGRAYWRLNSQATEKITPKIIGFQEMGLGLVTILLTVLGYVVDL